MISLNGLQTITQLTTSLGVSTRTLRYYERIGLLESRRVDDYAYRMYDEIAIARLKQIVILRKLRVPLKQIAQLLSDDGTVNAIELFLQNINELDDEITSLSTIRNILQALVDKLRENASIRISEHLLSDKKIMALTAPLSLNKFTLKEADEKLSKLTDRDVRIIYLPPMTVAACQSDQDEGNEGYCGQEISKFLFANDLFSLKPDMRSFGFNIFIENNIPETGKASPCWEHWVSIPEDIEVPEPLFKRRFLGGLYAAHMIKMGGWDDWEKLGEWAKTSELYEFDWNPRCEPDQAYMGKRYEPDKGFMDPSLEEYLNFYNNTQNPELNGAHMQLDLLLPIKEKS